MINLNVMNTEARITWAFLYRRFFSGCGILLMCLLAIDAFATENKNTKRHTFEFGIAGISQYLREYRGSKTTALRAIALPFFVYRGDFFKVDRNGARAEFLATDRFEFKLSGGGSLSGGGTRSEARRGMPELDSAFELGPSFNVNITGENFNRGLQANFPIRAVVSYDGFDLTQRGYIFNPKFQYKFPPFAKNWSTRVEFGAIYGTRDFHSYYYDVAPEFVTETRAEFSSSSGYSGTFSRVTVRKRGKKYFYGMSFRYDNLSGSVIEDSPLVETNDFFTISFVTAYIFWTP